MAKSRPIKRALTILRQQVWSQFEVFVQELDIIIGMLFSWKKSIMWKVKPFKPTDAWIYMNTPKTSALEAPMISK